MPRGAWLDAYQLCVAYAYAVRLRLRPRRLAPSGAVFPLIEIETTPPCPTGKLTYTRSESRKAAKGIKRRTGVPCSAYRCATCGLWHIASDGRKSLARKRRERGLVTR